MTNAYLALRDYMKAVDQRIAKLVKRRIGAQEGLSGTYKEVTRKYFCGFNIFLTSRIFL